MSGAAPAHHGGHAHATAPATAPAGALTSPPAGALTSPPAGAFASSMDAAMARMMDAMHAAPPDGDPDRDFLAMMIPHHEGALEMARLLLLHGRDPLTRQLAEEIMAGQAVEIAAMRGRLAVLRAARNGEDYPTLGGTRGGGRAR